MNHYFCYILYSATLDSFYTGSTILEPGARLERHLSGFYGSTKYTSKAKDWELYIEISCSSLNQARQIERHIKRMKSKKYINDLVIYPEIIEKLKVMYT